MKNDRLLYTQPEGAPEVAAYPYWLWLWQKEWPPREEPHAGIHTYMRMASRTRIVATFPNYGKHAQSLATGFNIIFVFSSPRPFFVYKWVISYSQ